MRFTTRFVIGLRACNSLRSAVRYIHWQGDGTWLGYFEEFPDYVTQGKPLVDRGLTSGEIPGIRRVAELTKSPLFKQRVVI